MGWRCVLEVSPVVRVGTIISPCFPTSSVPLPSKRNGGGVVESADELIKSRDDIVKRDGLPLANIGTFLDELHDTQLPRRFRSQGE